MPSVQQWREEEEEEVPNGLSGLAVIYDSSAQREGESAPVSDDDIRKWSPHSTSSPAHCTLGSRSLGT